MDMSTPAQETLSFSPNCRLHEVNAKDVPDMIASVGSHLDKMDKLVSASEAKEREAVKETEALLEEADRLLKCARPLATASAGLELHDRENTNQMVAETQLDADTFDHDAIMISQREPTKLRQPRQRWLPRRWQKRRS